MLSRKRNVQQPNDARTSPCTHARTDLFCKRGHPVFAGNDVSDAGDAVLEAGSDTAPVVVEVKYVVLGGNLDTVEVISNDKSLRVYTPIVGVAVAGLVSFATRV